MLFGKLIAFLLLAYSAFGAYPIGVPDPWVSPWEAKPTRPSPWSSEVPGYYYVNDATGTDSGRTYGTPSAPRNTIPNPLPAGSYVEVEGLYQNQTGGFTPLRGTANGSAWSANSAGPAWVTSSPSGQAFLDKQTLLYGSYVYVDNLAWTNGGRSQIGSTSTGYGADHIVIRNSTVWGTKSGASTGVPCSAYVSTPIDYTLIFNNTIKNWGDTNSPTDDDACGIIIGRNHSHAWVLNNDITGCSGSGIRCGGSSATDDPDLAKWHYIGSNYIHEVRQSGIATKYGANVVYSQNKIRNIITTDWSPSKGLFAQYCPKGLWIINNDVAGCEYGIRLASTSGSDWGGVWYVYVLNNVVSNCYYFSSPYNVRPSGEGAIHFDGATHRYVIGNSVTDSDAGILFSCSGGTVVAENNAIGHIRQSSAHLWVENTAGITLSFRNNLFAPTSESCLIKWGSGPTIYSTPAAFDSAQAAADGNIAGSTLWPALDEWWAIPSGSAAYNAGLADTALYSNVYDTYYSTFGVDIKRDIAGTTRPQNGAWDIGAYEYGVGANAAPRGRRINAASRGLGL